MRALALCILLAATAQASADPHPMSSGATPAPTDDAQVAMTQEDLTITMDLRWAEVTAAVTLENRGPAVTLPVGFPCATGSLAGAIDVPCKVPLAVTVKGKKVKVKKRKASPELSHWMWPISLAAGEVASVVVRYRAPLINERYSSPAAGMGLFSYRLTTGARWAGPIGKLTITLDHLHDALLYVSPPGYRREPGRITWTLVDHEPTAEVIMIPDPRAGLSLAAELGALDKKKRGKSSPTEYLRARLAAGDYPRAAVEAVLARVAKNEENDEWLALISRVANLPTPPAKEAQAATAESITLLKELAARATK